MRTSDEILRENFAWLPKSLAPDAIYDKFLAQMKIAINEARRECINECAEVAEVEEYGEFAGEIDKQSILKLKEQIK